MQPQSDPLLSNALDLWRPPQRLQLSEWADRYARLSAESAAAAGKWRTIPYQREIMDAFTDPRIDMVVVQKSARVGYTKILNNLIGYHIHQDPCPIMVVQPTVEDAEGYSKDEIAPMVRDTPELRALVSDPKAKDGSNTILAKQYPGGTLQMVGANSARGFRRVSRRIVLFDEPDGYPPSTPEGDQIKLGMKRAEYYWNRKIGMGSTPTIKGFSRIESWFLKTDQRRYFVPCPDCGHMQYLRWQQFVGYKEGQPENTRYKCESCDSLIDHVHKARMVERGEWRPTATSSRPGLVGFHIWAAYSYSPNAAWSDLAREFLEVKGSKIQLQTFVNTTLGETFEEDYANAVSADGLMARREAYEPGTVPDDVLVLTMGVDVQDDRLALAIWGWGVGESASLIWQAEISGAATAPEVWEQLDTVRRAEWCRPDGVVVPMVLCGVDSGDNTHEVYRYVRERSTEPVVAIKGSSTRGKPVIGKGSKQDVSAAGKVIKRGITLYLIGTDTAKTTLMGRLRHQTEGPGSFRFGMAADERFFQQLTAEKQRVRYDRQGAAIREWFCPKGVRNEQTDCLVYAYAMLQLHRRRYNTATYWDQMAERLQPLDQPPPPPEAPTGTAPLESRQPRRRGGFVQNW